MSNATQAMDNTSFLELGSCSKIEPQYIYGYIVSFQGIVSGSFDIFVLYILLRSREAHEFNYSIFYNAFICADLITATSWAIFCAPPTFNWCIREANNAVMVFLGDFFIFCSLSWNTWVLNMGALDCYLAVCRPFYHNQHWTRQKCILSILLACGTCSLLILLNVMLTLHDAAFDSGLMIYTAQYNC